VWGGYESKSGSWINRDVVRLAPGGAVQVEFNLTLRLKPPGFNPCS
jgi:hypothetical protein